MRRNRLAERARRDRETREARMTFETGLPGPLGERLSAHASRVSRAACVPSPACRGRGGRGPAERLVRIHLPNPPPQAGEGAHRALSVKHLGLVCTRFLPIGAVRSWATIFRWQPPPTAAPHRVVQCLCRSARGRARRPVADRRALALRGRPRCVHRRREGAGFRRLGWQAESTIPLNPDLVLVGPWDRSLMQRLLRALGFRVVEVDVIADLAGARARSARSPHCSDIRSAAKR